MVTFKNVFLKFDLPHPEESEEGVPCGVSVGISKGMTGQKTPDMLFVRRF